MTPEDLAAIRAESEIEHAPDVCYEDWRRHVMGLLEHIDSQAEEIGRLRQELTGYPSEMAGFVATTLEGLVAWHDVDLERAREEIKRLKAEIERLRSPNACDIDGNPLILSVDGGADGLCYPGERCGCGIDDLAPCGECDI